MNTRMMVLVFACVPLLQTTTAAAVNTGGELLRYCEQAERVFSTNPNVSSGANVDQANQCLAFIQGVLGGVRMADVLSNVKYTLLCTPSGVRNEQFIRVVLSWLRQKPEALHEDAGALVALALIAAFPCGK